jgi:hypothetical protein
MSNCIFRINNRIGGVMVSVLASSTVDRGFEPRSGQNKDYKIGICEDIYFVQMLLNMKSIVIITGYYYFQ